jgi:hypothetical protein
MARPSTEKSRLKKPPETNGPTLEVGQVWTVREREIAIVRLGKFLGEYRDYRDGKVVTRGRAGLKSIRQIQRELVDAGAKLTGRFESAQRFL